MPFPPTPCHPGEDPRFQQPEVGMTVLVFEDPVTKEKPEGFALITKDLGDNRFIVEFTDDEDGIEYERTVYGNDN